MEVSERVGCMYAYHRDVPPSLDAFLITCTRLPFSVPIVVDLNDWGHNGVEPQQLKDMRQFVQQENPDFYKLVHQDDPLIQKYIDDPTLAMREAHELMTSTADAATTSAF